MEGFTLQEGYYVPVASPQPGTGTGTGTTSLTNPSNMFQKQDAVLNNLNQFQTQYARYLRCQDPNTYSQVSPPCNVDGQDSFGSLTTAYRSLLTSIHDMSGAYAQQSQNDPNAKPQVQYEIDEQQIVINYNKLVKMRAEMDQQLKLLYQNMNNNPDTSTRMLESGIYANTLWVILASCLVYYIFVEL